MIFTNRKNYGTISMSHKLNKDIGDIFCFRDIIPFFVHTQIYELGKNAGSANLSMAEIFLFRLVCVTTIGVCVFRCVASVAHLF